MSAESERLLAESENLRVRASILELLSLGGDPAPPGNGEPLRLVAEASEANAVDDEIDDSDEPPPVTRRVRVKIHTPPEAA